MATRVRFVVALLSLACCSTTVAGQFSASFWETWGHYMQLASTKPIDWNATIGLRDSGQVQENCYDQSVQLHTDMTTGQSYAIQMLDSSGKLNPTALFEGRYDDFGSFKGCRDRVKYAPDIPADMKPMYCILGWSGIAPELTGGAQSFTQGLCVPNTCSDLEVGLLANTGLLGTKPMPSWTVVGILCHREEVYASFDTGAYVAFALLVSYLFMKQLKKNGGSFTGKDLLLHYLHRYWRLTPVYAFLIMIFACLMMYMGTGPVWASPANFATGSVNACQTWMWTNLLYINNWFNGEQELYAIAVAVIMITDHSESVCISRTTPLPLPLARLGHRRSPVACPLSTPGARYSGSALSPASLNASRLPLSRPLNLTHPSRTTRCHGGMVCFGWSWYLGVDMQLYVIAPGLLVLLYNVDRQAYYATVYKYTFTRMGPYMVGLLMGYILFTTDRKVPNTRSTKALMLLGWFGATAVAILFVGAPGWIGSPFSIIGQPAWRAFDRTMFSCAVAWVVFACCVGYGGIITEFLSWSGWVPLSRLTYTAYLVHPIIMHVYTMSLKTPLFYSATNWWFYFIAYSFMAFLCGFVASIMVEFPFFGIEKLIFPQRRGRDSSKASNNVTNEAHDNQALELGETSQPVDDRAAKSNGQMAITNDENDKIPGQANGQWSVSISANQETFDQKL
uniref:Nose resistant-to-fluoxetine protein N-terminal domain-containing protein n=1 Tax=Branchiostoma floridae TaxID=7739 RepID=C3ZYW9_BRAFL|eukprot:XP_002586229.1 hypothetical protein BRAFLDRAFT_132369 [Branchiostoma floridae]